MYGICYLRVFDYVSVSYCATGLARESKVYPERNQMGKKNERTYHSHTTTAWWLKKFKKETIEVEIKATLEEGGDRSARTHSPLKKNPETHREF